MLATNKPRSYLVKPHVAIRIIAALVFGAFFWAALSTNTVNLPSGLSLSGTPANPPRPWNQPTIRKTICDNSCPFARNGVCDDGRDFIGFESLEQSFAYSLTHPANSANNAETSSYYNVRCDLGTDCDDCGPWEFHGIPAAAKWTPVADLMARKVELRAKHASNGLDFVMPYTSPEQDVDVSHQMEYKGYIEPGYTALWHHLLSDGCEAELTNDAHGRGNDGADGATTKQGRRGLVLDVGGNFGYYSFLSASLGCNVVAWEPVPLFAAFFKYGLLRNGFTARVDLREHIVGDVSGTTLTMVVPNRGIWGTAGVDGANIDRNIPNDGDYERVRKSAETVGEVIGSGEGEILIMKADVEGFEPAVLRGARPLFQSQRIANLIMEYSPGVPEMHQDWPKAREQPRMLYRMTEDGYQISMLAVRGMQSDHSGIFTDKLPNLPQVTPEMLRHDIADTDRLGTQKLGCPLPTELSGLQPGLWRCGAAPEALHPLSFRTTFGHNTNIWARRAPHGEFPPSWVTTGGTYTIYPMDFDFSQEFFAPWGVGSGARACAQMSADVAVAHRCPCPDKNVCGELENRVMELTRQGKLKPRKD